MVTSPGALSPNGSIPSPGNYHHHHNGDMRMMNGYMHHGPTSTKTGAKKKHRKSSEMNGGHRHNGKPKRTRKKRASTDMPPELSPPASISPPHCYDRTPPPLSVYQQNSTPQHHMAEACGGDYQSAATNGHMPPTHHNQCMDASAMMNGGAQGGATHINSMHKNSRPDADIGADIGAVASAHPVQNGQQGGHMWRNGTHEDEANVMQQIAASQPNISNCMMQGAPSSHSLVAAAAISQATSPPPVMSPSKASPYGSPHNGQMLRQQQHPNSPYATATMNVAHLNPRGGEMQIKGHKSPVRRLSGNDAGNNMRKYATHNGATTQIPNNPHNAIMATAMEKFPTPPSQHSQHPGSAENTPNHVPSLINYVEQHYPTPSPESPGQWSSSSPQSADNWSGSEGIQSPQQPQLNNCQYTQSPGTVYL